MFDFLTGYEILICAFFKIEKDFKVKGVLSFR